MKDDCASEAITDIVVIYYRINADGTGRAVHKMVISHLTKQCESTECWSFYGLLWKRKSQRKSLYV